VEDLDIWLKIVEIKEKGIELEKKENWNIIRHGSHLKMKVCGVGLDIYRV